MYATSPPVTPAPSPPPARTSSSRGTALVLAACAVLAVAIVASIALGARDISPPEVVRILLHPDGTGYNSHVLWTERIPRTLLGLTVGAALGASGLMMQALTMNPLADPGILGIEQGAAMFVVLGILFLDITGVTGYFWLALAGAAFTSTLVYLIGTRTNAGSSTLGLVLAGVALAAVMSSLITLLVVRDEAVYAHLRFWSMGQLTGRGAVLDDILPFAVAGLLAALPFGRTLNVLSMGEDAARGLGVRVERSQLLGAAVAVLLCAAATAAVGPVAFVGLVAAHCARMLAGADHRWSLPLSMACGAILLIGADIAGRLVLDHGEIQVGVMTAVVGTPFFVWLARRRNLVRV
ncbi:iron complex transport system permease protein [Streptomyces sp. ScaeMP-e48]|uniref:FecCD family ABC transporter permease n=1 Tax=Streptomyces TaxID=1883 RepID=UPI000823D267|nr:MULTISPECIES: iron ABC transporter permease [Streptomyces]MCX4650711.1 iron ABC transporter permease [Streptomyces microflavus]WSA59157.1 iron ABC transporter permease [Streptomyces microflavus]SCK50001.1 iron complex transport system permease protein [Streptomyces sp. ScaeMP-e48]